MVDILAYRLRDVLDSLLIGQDSRAVDTWNARENIGT